jgi:hypothetical protein
MNIIFFEIDECPHRSCIHHHKTSCWLDKQSVEKYAYTVEDLHNSHSCKARETVNEYRMENMLKDK